VPSSASTAAAVSSHEVSIPNKGFMAGLSNLPPGCIGRRLCQT
jgi:hypothetical protein